MPSRSVRSGAHVLAPTSLLEMLWVDHEPRVEILDSHRGGDVEADASRNPGPGVLDPEHAQAARLEDLREWMSVVEAGVYAGMPKRIHVAAAVEAADEELFEVGVVALRALDMPFDGPWARID
jgi:hypothetical protein